MSAVIAPKYGLATKHIYNHDIMNCSAIGVAGNHLHSGRALGISKPWDMIQIHRLLKPFWKEITAHYDRIGLSYTSDVIWYLGLKQIGLHIGYQPSVFYYGPGEYENWGDYEWYQTAEYINSRNNFISLCHDLDIATPLTFCFDTVLQIKNKHYELMRYPCYIKPDVSTLNDGTYRCEDASELRQYLTNFNESKPIQIQEEINTDIFLNLQYDIVGDEIIRLETSEHIINCFAHEGNRVPAQFTPWDTVDPIATWLHDRGMKGIFSFTVGVEQTSQGLRFPVIDCKPRFTEASYPALIAQKLNISDWSSYTYSTKYRYLENIDLSDIEYDKKTGEGAIIVDWGTILNGELTMLLAGSSDYQEALNIELEARL